MTNNTQSDSTQTIAWDAGLASRLEGLRITVDSDDIAASGPTIVTAIRCYGFALLKGLGQDGSRDTTITQLVTLSESLGKIVAQSPRGEMVEDVRDFSDVDERDDRGYRSAGELTAHSDPPTLIVLHCLRPAKSGGESHIVNVQTIHDHIRRHNPALLETLYQGFPFWQVEGMYGVTEPGPAPDQRPVFTQTDHHVSCVIYRPFIELAATASGKPLTSQQVAALDLFEACTNAPNLALRFNLAAGETMILHNRTVLHARTDYEDWPEQDRRRHLLRVWIDAPDTLPVDPVHELGDLFGNKTDG